MIPNILFYKILRTIWWNTLSVPFFIEPLEAACPSVSPYTYTNAYFIGFFITPFFNILFYLFGFDLGYLVDALVVTSACYTSALFYLFDTLFANKADIDDCMGYPWGLTDLMEATLGYRIQGLLQKCELRDSFAQTSEHSPAKSEYLELIKSLSLSATTLTHTSIFTSLTPTQGHPKSNTSSTTKATTSNEEKNIESIDRIIQMNDISSFDIEHHNKAKIRNINALLYFQSHIFLWWAACLPRFVYLRLSLPELELMK